MQIEKAAETVVIELVNPTPTALSNAVSIVSVDGDKMQVRVEAGEVKKFVLWPLDSKQAQHRRHRHVSEFTKVRGGIMDRAIRALDKGSLVTAKLQLSRMNAVAWQEQGRVVLPLHVEHDAGWGMYQRYCLVAQRGSLLVMLSDRPTSATAQVSVGDIWDAQTRVFNFTKARETYPLANKEGSWQVVYVGPGALGAWSKYKFFDPATQPRGLFVVLVPADREVRCGDATFNVAPAFLRVPTSSLSTD